MQNKAYNRTLFVAALSVYLGLLIVGAPPQVLAQTLKAQELSNCGEISENAQNLRQIKLVSPLKELAEDIKKLIQIQEFNLKYDDSYFYLNRHFVSPKNGDEYYTTTNSSSRWVDLVFEKAIDEIRVEKLVALPDFTVNEESKKREKSQSFEIRVRKSGLELSISFKKSSPEKAKELAGDLNQAFAANACEETQDEAKQIYENTKVSFENNQVFIVTRLPRAGLDALLKADERAD